MRSVIVAMAGLLFGLSGSALAQTVHPPIEAYGRLPSVIDAQISPDGQRVALLTYADDHREVQVYDLEAKAYTHAFDARDLETNYIRFGDPDHLLLMASAPAGPQRSWQRRMEIAAVMVLNLANGKTIGLLSREDRILPYQLDLSYIVGRLDNGQLLIPAFVGNKGGAIRRNLLRADPDSGRGFTHGIGEADTYDWFVDRTGAPLVRESYDFETHQFALQVKNGSAWRTFYEQSDAREYPMWTVAVTENEDGLYFRDYLEQTRRYDELSIIRFDGSIERGVLKKDGHDIERVYTDTNRHALGVRYSGSRPTYAFVDERLDANYTQLSRNLPGATITIDSWSDDRNRVLYRIFDGRQADFWLLYNSKTGKAMKLASTRKDIPPEAVGQVYSINYPGEDGTVLTATVTVPPGKTIQAGSNLPMVVLPQTGAIVREYGDFDWMAQFFANRGYLVLQPTMRGTATFGGAYISSGNTLEDTFQVADIAAGVTAMISDGMADADRICILGVGNNGFTALMGAALAPDLYACSAAYGPVTDIITLMKDYRERYIDDQLVASWQRILGETDTETLGSSSPIGHIEDYAAPILLIHGKNDLIVPPDQSQRMYTALKQAGKPATLVTLDKGDHSLSESDPRLETLKSLAAFVDSHTGASAASSGQ
ncbi:alpha/beta hydrolase family protein [Henriciella aquimarina]|uniref:alpha/beta hydrolase family protein n=1 Tax=Henriciella aquimarina TaxID=545261 RepID=UPI001179BAD6|nr:prolyl oligopeptidase family serine peptidase [Henriciella aquimarina]